MSFPSDRSQDTSSSSNPASHFNSGLAPSRIVTKTAHGQGSVWGSSSQQQPSSLSRRGLTPLSTTSVSAFASGAASGSGFTHQAKPSSPTPARNNAAVNSSRHSSVSSSSSVLSPSATAGTGFSNRYKPATSPHISSSGGGFANHDRSAPLSAGGTSRYSRQNSAAGLPGTFGGSGITTPATGQLTSLVLTQLNILFSTLKEDVDRPSGRHKLIRSGR